ncbi:MAG TPA: MFS transporter [Acidobacteria bacterium]|nr:MFS transporter [Acidobacteriota bacterium]
MNAFFRSGAGIGAGSTQGESGMAQAKHPRGLYVLFFTEMWERFSFYTMFAVFVLYMDEAMHLPSGQLHNTYAFYSGFVYFTPLLGGWLADRWLGCRKAVLIGGGLMALGHFGLFLGTYALFYPALVLLVLGNGFFKPNISTMVGNLYSQNSPLRDSAFNIFYMGINVGAFIAPLSAGWLHHNVGFRWAFFSAAAGMVLSTVILVVFNRTIAHADGSRALEEGEREVELEPTEERQRIWALMVVFGIVIIFWTAYMQYGDVLMFWARDYTAPFFGRWDVPAEWYQSVNPIFIILFTPLVVWLWGALNRRGREPSTGAKMLYGMILTAVAFLIMVQAARLNAASGEPVGASWLISFYAVITLSELFLSPMGLSYVTRVSPPRMRSTMMGLWFVASGVGGYLSGFLGHWWESLPHATYFLVTVAASLVAVVLMALSIKTINHAEAASEKSV